MMMLPKKRPKITKQQKKTKKSKKLHSEDTDGRKKKTKSQQIAEDTDGRKKKKKSRQSVMETKLKVKKEKLKPSQAGCPIEIQPSKDGSLRGMRKWLADYHSKRPGFAALQQQTDEFIADFEAQEEKARQEREAAAIEEGWTVVGSHKGRKKTTDLESGVTVGGVASAAVENRLKKKNEDFAVNFYRFQRREARKNEILELQQRFEEDKKKIAMLRAARKFRPF